MLPAIRPLPANPIIRAELAYQARSAPRQRRWVQIGIRFILIAAFTLAFILAGGEFAGALLHRDAGPISRFFGSLNLLPFGVAVLFHFILMLRTLSLSANSIAREKQANNWDILVLTGVDARQIIRGKWWATVRRMWRAYLLLAVLRAAVIIWLGASASRAELGYGSFYYNGLYRTPEIIAPAPAYFLLAAGVVFVLTMVNLLFTAACGVSAIFARRRNRALALVRAIGTRVLLLLGLSIGLIALTSFVWSRIDRYDYVAQSNFEPISQFMWRLSSTLLENGGGAGAWLASYRLGVDEPRESALVVVLVSLCIYLLLTLLLLRFAQWLAVRQNALRPLTLNHQKPARMV